MLYIMLYCEAKEPVLARIFYFTRVYAPRSFTLKAKLKIVFLLYWRGGLKGVEIPVKIKICSEFHTVNPERTDTAQYLALIFAGLSDINGGSREDMKSAEKSVNDIISDMFEDDSEKLDIFTEGTLTSCDGRISISYNETELTGMEGTVTTITFKMDEPGIITVLRTGSVYTALTLEEGRRHICVYKAQGVPFELYANAKRIRNSVTEDGGMLELIYTVETYGADAQFNHLKVEITPLRQPETEGGQTICH